MCHFVLSYRRFLNLASTSTQKSPSTTAYVNIPTTPTTYHQFTNRNVLFVIRILSRAQTCRVVTHAHVNCASRNWTACVQSAVSRSDRTLYYEMNLSSREQRKKNKKILVVIFVAWGGGSSLKPCGMLGNISHVVP